MHSTEKSQMSTLKLSGYYAVLMGRIWQTRDQAYSCDEDFKRVSHVPTIILFIHLCGHTAWSLTLREEHSLRVFREQERYLHLRGTNLQGTGQNYTRMTFMNNPFPANMENMVSS
jgi:hypothetical protein